jgi:hypothetical protein
MRPLAVLSAVLWSALAFAQEPTPDEIAREKEKLDFNAADSLYREDQFYFGFTYNILQNKPEKLEQNKFSSGLGFGFLRDMPINKRRTWAIAAGLGYSINNFNHNFSIAEIDGDRVYTILDGEVSYDKSKHILHYVDLPVEIRWRTSTPLSHKFWRVYTGLKLSYLVFNRYKYKDANLKFSNSNNPDLNKLMYGAYLAVGYNTWNVNLYYGFSPIFKRGTLEGEPIDMRTLNIGLMFYIL